MRRPVRKEVIADDNAEPHSGSPLRPAEAGILETIVSF